MREAFGLDLGAQLVEGLGVPGNSLKRIHHGI
jgi:hypothetical protein